MNLIKGIAQIFSNREDFTKELTTHIKGKRIFILTDTRVNDACLSGLIKEVAPLQEAEILEIYPGDVSKSVEVCAHLWEHLLECNADRKALLINIGGGVVSDLGGFVASTYKRGIPFIHIPTSLLGMTDAAIGGKTGINHAHIKNSIGTFCLPENIFVYPGFLETLDVRELKSGFAEMLKHALIKDKEHWKNLISINNLSVDSIAPHIQDSIRIKEAVVQKDFYETGERKLLNFGHTIGHALESYYLENNVSVTHGDAVALGIIVESTTAVKLGKLTPEEKDEIIKGITKYFSLSDYDFPSFNKVEKYLLNDKKNKGNELRLSLVTGIGKAEYDIKVSNDIVKQAYTEVFSTQ